MQKHSWRTTTAGILTAVAAIAAAAKALLDADPTTNPDWALVTTSLAAAWGLITARDNKVTSEDVGAK